jgi:hypothetical protein
VVQDQRSDVRLHRRYLKPAPFVTAAIVILVSGGAIVISPLGIITVCCLICMAFFVIMCYLEGPTKSVTVRRDTLEVNNTISRYLVPAARILSIEYRGGLGVLVRVEGDKTIWIGAMSRSYLRGRDPYLYELKANANSLTDALFAAPVPADHRPVQKRYRWFNLFLYAAVAIGLLTLKLVVAPS